MARCDSPVAGAICSWRSCLVCGPCSSPLRLRGHRTPSCQTPVRDGPNRDRLLSIYRRLEPIPCRKTSRFEPPLLRLVPNAPVSKPSERSASTPPESNQDVRAPLIRFENHLYV